MKQYIKSRMAPPAWRGTIAVGALLACHASAFAGDLPGGGGATGQLVPAMVRACPRHGEGFFTIPGTDSCIRIGGLARLEVAATAPLPIGVSDRMGFSALGRINIDARTVTEWGTVRTFVRLGVQSLTGRSVSGDMARQADAFAATGVDTFGRAQKGVLLDRAFIQFGGLTAGRSNSFFDFYAHDLELIGVTPVSDPPPVNLLAYTFKAGHGLSLTVAAEDPTSRRAPLAYAGFRNGKSVLDGGIPVAPVPADRDATGAPVFRMIDMRQRLNMPDVTAALRMDADWGAVQLSGALHEVTVGQFVGPADRSVQARRPDARYGYAVQAGLMLNMQWLGAGDKLWLQASAARGAIGYTGANALAGADALSGSPFGHFDAWAADGYIGPDGKLQLSESWSAVAALQHYWRPDLAHSVFAGMSRISYGAGNPAGLGEPGGFSNRLVGDHMYGAGTQLAWSPVPDLTIAGEVAWTRLHMAQACTDLGRAAVLPARMLRNEQGWLGRLRIERSF